MNEIQGSSLRWLPTCEEGAANLKEYTEAVGKVVQSSNYLQEKLALLLAAILQTDLTVTLAMWYSTDNDRIQRNFLRAAASAAKSERWNGPPYARKDILWLLHEADTLASMRSLAVNAPCSLYIAGPKEEYLELGPAFFKVTLASMTRKTRSSAARSLSSLIIMNASQTPSASLR